MFNVCFHSRSSKHDLKIYHKIYAPYVFCSITKYTVYVYLISITRSLFIKELQLFCSNIPSKQKICFRTNYRLRGSLDLNRVFNIDHTLII